MANKPTIASQDNYSHDQVKELLELVAKLQLEELEIESREFRLRIVGRRPVSAAPVQAPAPAATLLPAEATSFPPASVAASTTPAAEDISRYTKVSSPMIGTFYRSPAPDAPNFANVGDQVEENSVLCIIEAMKLMNEIKAETRGIVRKILVENGQPVEYGQPMFLIEPA